MADKKLTELDAITVVTPDDIFYVVDDPLVTPVSKKITAANLLSSMVDEILASMNLLGWY